MSASSKNIASMLASRFGLTVSEESDSHGRTRGVSLFFVGDKANETTFRAVRGALLTENEGHEFQVQGTLPGIHARGYTPSGAFGPIYLVVMGDPAAAQYAPMGPAVRG